MFFLRTLQPPVAVKWGERTLTIPKFTVDDAVAWGAEIQSDRDSKATEGMEEQQRREFQAFYPSIPPDLNELRKLVKSITGSRRVITTCLGRATTETGPLNKDEVATIIAQNGTTRLAGLAIELSDLYDDIRTDPNAPPPETKPPATPSTTSNPPVSNVSPATGPTT